MNQNLFRLLASVSLLGFNLARAQSDAEKSAPFTAAEREEMRYRADQDGYERYRT